MSTTTIRLESRLKARLAAAARRAGKTPHAFILDAIAATVDEADQADEMHRVADERWAGFLATGETVSLDDAEAYLRVRARNPNARKPRARKLTR